MVKKIKGKTYCDCLDTWNDKDRHVSYMNDFEKKLHTTGVTKVEEDNYYIKAA